MYKAFQHSLSSKTVYVSRAILNLSYRSKFASVAKTVIDFGCRTNRWYNIYVVYIAFGYHASIILRDNMLVCKINLEVILAAMLVILN